MILPSVNLFGKIGNLVVVTALHEKLKGSVSYKQLLKLHPSLQNLSVWKPYQQHPQPH
jgi:hypothetical protein